MFDLVTVGHFAIDLILTPGTETPRPALGGPPTYVSLAARRLGARVSVVSKVGGDFPDEYVTWLSAGGVDLSGLRRVPGARTTSFLLEYGAVGRRLQLRSRAPPIDPGDLPGSLEARAIHMSPIAGEVRPGVVDRLRGSAGVLSLDPQGFVRRFGEDGSVSLGPWADPKVLRQIDIYKSSAAEVRAVTGRADLRSAMERIRRYGVGIVLVTRGGEGSTLLSEEGFREVPACEPAAVRDPTGAGDAFIGAFLAEYVRGRDPLWCARVGSAAASFVVEGLGPAVFGGSEDVYARANRIGGP